MKKDRIYYIYRAPEEGFWDSRFRFQTYPGFRIQISNRVVFKIQMSNHQDSDFKRVGIQDSDFKWQGFRIQIMSSRAMILTNDNT